MNKICTSIEQSKKLIELGIDVYTADMYWKNGVSDKYIQCFTPFVGSGTDIDYDYDLPAWSLSALLDIIPNWTMDKTDKINLTCNIYYLFYHYKMDYNDSVDAAFEMICWLKENGKI